MQRSEPAAYSRFGFAPWRLSGVVYAALLNDRATLAALGDAVHRPPYKAPPQAPVLAPKPRNTLAASGAAVAVPIDPGVLEIGASLGIVIRRTACHVGLDTARDFIAGWVLMADLGVPLASHYRPSVRLRARDGSYLVGPRVVAAAELPDPDALSFEISVDGRPVHTASTDGRVRPVAPLLRDVTEFMTLYPGDILMLGVAHGAPCAAAGSRFAIDGGRLGRIEGRLVAEAPGVPA